MEAHPADSPLSFGDSVSGEWNITKPKNIEERIQKAKHWHTKTRAAVPLLVDNFEDEANLTFGAWSERFYILQGSKVAWQGGDGMPGPNEYSVNLAKKALKEILSAA
eukprot:gnl/MRDRNA2_/MRDRNA2_271859_c0_seq1.p1 gnl/MRDRNA2_/MRDRNA2_271859_c0~~gnl/MRDRNA2_/MRDRNA2_271859_c0_seq1.p1  ORF type:complete len:107 (+),score=29.87 gnl/MRDRNA2_/MRDRNA2_271859_c0_seq1:110-430(+)